MDSQPIAKVKIPPENGLQNEPRSKEVSIELNRLVSGKMLSLSAVVGKFEMSAEQLLSGAEQTITMERSIGDPIDIEFEGKVVARGEIVAAGDRFGIRIVEVCDLKVIPENDV
jgi:flagellar motor switch protein FliN